MKNRWCHALLLLALAFSLGCASSKEGKPRKPKAAARDAYLQQTGSNIIRKLDLEDEEAERKQKKERKKRPGTGTVDEDFVLRGGFR